QGVVDYRDRCRSIDVTSVEFTAAEYGNPKSAEVGRSHCVRTDIATSARIVLLSLNLDSQDASGQRGNVSGERCAGDSGNRREPIEQLLGKRHSLPGSCISGSAQGNA